MVRGARCGTGEDCFVLVVSRVSVSGLTCTECRGRSLLASLVASFILLGLGARSQEDPPTNNTQVYAGSDQTSSFLCIDLAAETTVYLLHNSNVQGHDSMEWLSSMFATARASGTSTDTAIDAMRLWVYDAEEPQTICLDNSVGWSYRALPPPKHYLGGGLFYLVLPPPQPLCSDVRARSQDPPRTTEARASDWSGWSKQRSIVCLVCLGYAVAAFVLACCLTTVFQTPLSLHWSFLTLSM